MSKVRNETIEPAPRSSSFSSFSQAPFAKRPPPRSDSGEARARRAANAESEALETATSSSFALRSSSAAFGPERSLEHSRASRWPEQLGLQIRSICARSHPVLLRLLGQSTKTSISLITSQDRRPYSILACRSKKKRDKTDDVRHDGSCPCVRHVSTKWTQATSDGQKNRYFSWHTVSVESPIVMGADVVFETKSQREATYRQHGDAPKQAAVEARAACDRRNREIL